ncbi:hypothetical protein MRX96_018250 [Rhipicephalus microplus]
MNAVDSSRKRVQTDARGVPCQVPLCSGVTRSATVVIFWQRRKLRWQRAVTGRFTHTPVSCNWGNDARRGADDIVVVVEERLALAAGPSMRETKNEVSEGRRNSRGRSVFARAPVERMGRDVVPTTSFVPRAYRHKRSPLPPR